MESELAEKLVGEGFLSYDDLSVIEPDALMEMGGLSEEQVQVIVAQAEGKAEEAEKAAAEQRRQRREQQDRAAKSEDGGDNKSGATAVAVETEEEAETEDEAKDSVSGDGVSAEHDAVSAELAEGGAAAADNSPSIVQSDDGNHREHT